MDATLHRIMNRRLLGCLLIAALVWQGAAQAAVAVTPQPAAEQGCADHLAASDKGDCCPDRAMDATSCQLSCASVVAPTEPTTALRLTDPMAPEVRLTQPGAEPLYLPLNPPPIS